MSFDEILMNTEEHFEKSLASLDHDFRRLRTGRASVSMLDHVQVMAYGALVPLKQLASVSVPEPQQLLVKPYDKGTIKDIEKALGTADLGAQPASDGMVIRINLPPLSSERRKQLASQAKEMSEKCKVAMRNARRDGIKHIETLGKEQRLPEDLIKKSAEQVTELLKEYEGRADKALKAKSDDILNMG